MNVNNGVLFVGMLVAVGAIVGASTTVGASVNKGVNSEGACVPVGAGVGISVVTVFEEGAKVGDGKVSPTGCTVGAGDRFEDVVPKTGTKILLHFC